MKSKPYVRDDTKKSGAERNAKHEGAVLQAKKRSPPTHSNGRALLADGTLAVPKRSDPRLETA